MSADLADVMDRLTQAPRRTALVAGEVVEVVTILADDADRLTNHLGGNA